MTSSVDRGQVRTHRSDAAADKARHDKMVALVERMLELNKKKHSGKLAPSGLDRPRNRQFGLRGLRHRAREESN